jgi:hypothetical protein
MLGGERRHVGEDRGRERGENRIWHVRTFASTPRRFNAAVLLLTAWPKMINLSGMIDLSGQNLAELLAIPERLIIDHAFFSLWNSGSPRFTEGVVTTNMLATGFGFPCPQPLC